MVRTETDRQREEGGEKRSCEESVPRGVCGGRELDPTAGEKELAGELQSPAIN